MLDSKWPARLVITAALFIMGLSFTLSAGAAKGKEIKNEAYSFNVREGSKIIVENEKGDIAVESWDKNTCEINVFKSSAHPGNFDKIKIQTDAQPDRLKVRTHFSEKLDGNTGVDYVLFVPAKVDLQLKATAGNLQVRDFVGRVSLYTERGDIKLSHVTGAIDGRTESGNITLDVPTSVAQSIVLRTDDGAITAHVDKDAQAFISAEADEGTVKSTLALAATQVEAPTRLQGQLGRGGKLIHLQVGRGQIELSPTGGTVVAKGMEPSSRRVPATPEPSQRESSLATDVSPAVAVAADARTGEPGLSSRRAETGGEIKPGNGSVPVTSRAPQSGTTFSVATNLIMLNTTVKDRTTGRTINNLRRQDFLVYEDHVQQEVAHFSPVDTPFNLLLLLDISGSIREQFHIVQEASIQFVNRLRPMDRIAVAVFNSRFKVLADFTNDRSVLSRAINGASPGGGTAFYDAMERSINSVFRGVRGRKAIVVFTDGIDNQHQGYQRAHGSKTTFPELFRMIEEADITIYPIFLDTEGDNHAGVYVGGGSSIDLGQIIDILRGSGGIPSPRSPRSRKRVVRRSESELYQNARDELNKMAEQTGGWMYSPTAVTDLREVYGQIVNELSVQYSLGYYPPNPVADGKWRRTSVKIKNKPEYVARTRRGYYANFGSAAAKETARR